MRILTILLLTFAGFSLAANVHNTKPSHRTDYTSDSKVKQPPENLHEKTYVECDIAVGNVYMCHTFANSNHFPIRQSDGSFKDCNILTGLIDSCNTWSNAKKFPVRQKDGSYKYCNISVGMLGTCSSWANAKKFPIEKEFAK